MRYIINEINHINRILHFKILHTEIESYEVNIFNLKIKERLKLLFLEELHNFIDIHSLRYIKR